jgi:anti-anti-sigma regulatory factor
MSESGSFQPPHALGAAYRYRGDAGMRLVGEIDLTNHGVLSGALDLLAGHDGDVFLELSELTFLDVRGMQLLADLAAEKAPHRVVLESPSDLLRRIFGIIWRDTGLELA